ncbi:hypothetical protein C8R43DRAFT_1142218, partial [Mycena crocata]
RKKKTVNEGKEGNATAVPKPAVAKNKKAKKGGNAATEPAPMLPPVNAAPEAPQLNPEAPLTLEAAKEPTNMDLEALLTLDARNETSSADAATDTPQEPSSPDGVCSPKNNTPEPEDASDDWEYEPAPNNYVPTPEEIAAAATLVKNNVHCLVDSGSYMQTLVKDINFFDPEFDIAAWYRNSLETALASGSPYAVFPAAAFEDTKMRLRLEKGGARHRSATPGPGPDDHETDWESDGSDYVATAAKKAKALEEHNKVARQIPGAAVQLSIEEQDRLDDAEFGAGEERRGKDKGKGRKHHASEDEEEEEEEGGGGWQGEESEDDDDTAHGPWALRPGPISQSKVDKLLATRASLHELVVEVARTEGKRVSAVYKAMGETNPSSRTTNPWNAHQTKYRAENPKPASKSSEDYQQEIRAAYEELFSSLSDEDRSDPAKRSECTREVMEWYQSKSMQVMDNRRAEGRGKGLVNKALQPFIRESTIASQKYDLEIMGFAIDLHADTVVGWAGTPLGLRVFEAHRPSVMGPMTDVKTVFQMQAMSHRQLASNGTAQPRTIIFDDSKGTQRDLMRRYLPALFLNDICVALQERGEDWTDVKQMSWQWVDFATKFQVRIVNWPATLKNLYPAPGFSLVKVSAKPHSTVMQAMYADMKARYEGEEDSEGVKVVSWTEDERDLDDSEEIKEVALVTCEDGTVLSRAGDSKAWLTKIAKTAKTKGKAASGDDDGSSDDEGGEDDEEDAGKKAASKKRKAEHPWAGPASGQSPRHQHSRHPHRARHRLVPRRSFPITTFDADTSAAVSCPPQHLWRQ